jgi:hypothetical protein
MSSKSVSSEVTQQLKLMKQQLDKELADDLRLIREQITRDILEKVGSMVNTAVVRELDSRLRKNNDDLKKDVDNMIGKKFADVNKQITVAGDRQLALSGQASQEIALKMSKQVATEVYKKVVSEVNKEILPKFNNAVQWMNYQTQDTTELLTNYRRKVSDVSNGDGKKLLTHKDDGRVINEHVSMFFGSDD